MLPDTKKSLLACLLLTLVGFALYANTLHSPFVFDDTPSIEQNPLIESLWPLSRSFDAPPGAGSSGRPLVSFSLAVNYALGGRQVLGYHLFNIAILVLGAMALFGLARRVLLCGASSRASFGLAFSVALLWMVHPLQTDTLNHVVYRNGSMMALFYMLSLYCALRIFERERGGAWNVACVVCAVASMACKEVAVSIPFAVLALDRQCGAGSLSRALRQRRGLYLSLALSWLFLAWFVMGGERGDSVGFGHTEVIDGLDYLRTQTLAITKYLRLSILAGPFLFDYDGFPVVRQWSSVWLPTALLSAALAASIFGCWRRSLAGLLGLAFFATLAPTSSLIPLAGELVAEHRMYLPLAPLVALFVLFMEGRLRPLLMHWIWLAPALVLVLASVFGWSTVKRNEDYASRVSLWQDTVDKSPDSDRAWNHLALALKNEGRSEEAERAFLRTLEIEPTHAKASFNYGNLLFARGDLQGALQRFADAARDRPQDESMRFNHGLLLVQLGRLKEGLAEYRAALELRPDFVRPLMLLAWQLATNPEPGLRDGEEALSLARRLNQLSGQRLPRHLDILAAALAEVGEFAQAARVADDAAQRARASGKLDLAQHVEARAQLYRAGTSFRQ